MEFEIVESGGFDFNSVRISEPVFNELTKSYESDITYDGSKFLVKSDKFRIMDLYYCEKGYEVELEFLPESDNFYSVVKTMEELVRRIVTDNSETWLGVSLSRDVVDSKFKSKLELPDSLSSLPILRSIIPKVGTYVCNTDGDEVSLADLDSFQDRELQMLVSIDKICFTRTRIYLEIRPHTVKLSDSQEMFGDEDIELTPESSLEDIERLVL